MDRPGDDLLAGACLTKNQNRDFFVLNNPLNYVSDLTDWRAVADDATEVRLGWLAGDEFAFAKEGKRGCKTTRYGLICGLSTMDWHYFL